MRVKPTTPAVTFVNGSYTPLQQGVVIDLPDDVAEKLAAAGIVVAVDEAPEDGVAEKPKRAPRSKQLDAAPENK